MDDTRTGGRPPPRYASARKEAAAGRQEQRRRREAATARRLATRARNAAGRPRLRPPDDGRPLRFFVPEALDLDALPEPLRWCACYLVSTVHLHWVRRWRWHYRKGERGWVRLAHRLLEKVIPRKFLKEVKRLLLDLGVIECDGVVAPGKALGYRLGAGYRQTRVVFCPDEKLRRKVRRLYAERNRAHQPVHRALRADLDRVVVDEAKAGRVIAGLRPKPRKDRQVPFTTAEYRAALAAHVAVLAAGDHWLKIDKFGRAHTPVTSLKKELLGCLSLRTGDGDRPVTWIDLANSQPLFLGLLLLRYLGGDRQVRHRLRNASFGNGTHPYRAADRHLRAGRRQPAQPSPNPTGAPTRAPPPAGTTPLYERKNTATTYTDNDLGDHFGVTVPDAEEYLRLCERGRIYQALTGPGEDRRRVKRRLLVAFYRSERGQRRFPNRMWERFAKRFPTVAWLLRELKVKDFRRPAWLMQNIEATVFIHRICGRIKAERPDVPLLTKHDSLGTAPEYVDYVEAVVRDEFRRLGVEVTLKREKYP